MKVDLGTNTEVVTVGNQKGGCAKTTTTVNVSGAIARAGKKVLLIDMDPQGDATIALGLEKKDLKKTINEILIDKIDLAEGIYPTKVQGLDVIPATIELAGAELTISGMIGRESKLAHALQAHKDLLQKYDYIFIDTPPSLSLLTINALAASHSVVIPVQTEYYALDGLGHLVKTVDMVREEINPGLHIKGVVLTLYDERTNLSKEVGDEVRKFFEDKVYQTVIHRSIKMAEAPAQHELGIDYDPGGRVAQEFLSLAKEILAQRQNGTTAPALAPAAPQAEVPTSPAPAEPAAPAAAAPGGA